MEVSPLVFKGVPGIQAVTQGRGGGGVSECLKKISNDFCKMYFKTTSDGAAYLQA